MYNNTFLSANVKISIICVKISFNLNLKYNFYYNLVKKFLKALKALSSISRFRIQELDFEPFKNT